VRTHQCFFSIQDKQPFFYRPAIISVKPSFARKYYNYFLALCSLTLFFPFSGWVSAQSGPADSVRSQQHVNDSAGPDKLNAIALQARANGISADSLEINRYRKILSLFDSLHPLDDQTITTMVVSDKFLRTKAPAKVSDFEIQHAYDSIISSNPRASSLSFSDLRSYIETFLIIQKPENIAMIRSSADQQVQAELSKKKSSIVPRTQPDTLSDVWEPGELQIKGLSTDCVAYNEQTGKCVVTLEEFNKSSLTIRFGKTIPLYSVRLKLLDKTLNMKFLASSARETGYADLPEVKAEAALAMRDRSAEANGPVHSDQINEKRLKKAYDELFKRCFAPKEIVFLDIIGSTDSAFIDSLYRELTRETAAKKHARGRSSTIGMGFWQRADAQDLPRECAESTDSLDVGGYTGRITTRFGYFICRVARIEKTAEITFEKARQQLFVMLSSGSLLYQNGAPLSENEARNYYKHHMKSFVSEDTLKLRVWLMPAARIPPNDSCLMKTRYIYSESIRLPEPIQQDLKRAVTPDSIIGPLPTNYGVYFFQKKGVKKGGKQLIFKDVAAAICSKFASLPKTSYALPKSEQERLWEDEAIAISYWHKLMNDVPELNEKELAEKIQQGIISSERIPNEIPENIRKQIAQQEYKTIGWMKPLNDWKKAIRYNDRVLRSQN
jgi:hypothetical protein